MIERICTSNPIIIELVQKINELTDQVNTLTADVQMLLQKEEENNIDWDAFRAEAAKNILAGIATNISLYVREKNRCAAAVKDALALADELIKQLKEQ